MVATSRALTPTPTLSQPGGDGQVVSDTLSSSAVPAVLLLDLRETHRVRQDLLRMEKAANNQIEAVYRGLTGLKREQRARLLKQASAGVGHQSADTQCPHAQPDDDDEEGGGQVAGATPTEAAPADLADFLAQLDYAAARCTPLTIGRDYYRDARKPYEKRLEKLAQELPVWPWVAGVRGFGPLGLAQIAAECGDLHHYANPAKVWKRMGLALIDGQRQRKVSDPDLAARHGYSPQRRSIMYVLADSLIKSNGDGPYRTYYLAEKERQRAKLPDAPQAHIHNRALRHTAKRLLRDLWRAWRGHDDGETPADPAAHDATFLAAD